MRRTKNASKDSKNEKRSFQLNLKSTQNKILRFKKSIKHKTYRSMRIIHRKMMSIQLLFTWITDFLQKMSAKQNTNKCLVSPLVALLAIHCTHSRRADLNTVSPQHKQHAHCFDAKFKSGTIKILCYQFSNTFFLE